MRGLSVSEVPPDWEDPLGSFRKAVPKQPASPPAAPEKTKRATAASSAGESPWQPRAYRPFPTKPVPAAAPAPEVIEEPEVPERHWARKLYAQSCARSWHPDQIPLGADRKRWAENRGTEAERRFLRAALQVLACWDQRITPLTLGVYQQSEEPACRAYLLRQAFEESLAAEAGRYGLEALGEAEAPVEIPALFTWMETYLELAQAESPLMQRDQGVFFFILKSILCPGALLAPLLIARRLEFSGIATLFQQILQDLRGHRDFGIELLRRNAWKPEGDFLEQAALARTLHYAQEALSPSELLKFRQYLHYLANALLSKIDCPPLYKETENPFPWLTTPADPVASFHIPLPPHAPGSFLDWD